MRALRRETGTRRWLRRWCWSVKYTTGCANQAGLTILKVCRGLGPVEAGKRRCDLCPEVIGKKNLAAHRRRCERKLGVRVEEPDEEEVLYAQNTECSQH